MVFLFFLFIMTNSFSSVSSELHSLLYPIFSKINNENWDQNNGYVDDIENEYKCCIGAHICIELGIYNKVIGIYSFTEAREYLCKKFKLFDYQLEAIFHCAGSPENPFAGKPWKNHPLFVLDNIRYIETYPPIVKCYFGYYNRDDFKEWLEIERKRIERKRIERKRIEIGKEREKLLCTV